MLFDSNIIARMQLDVRFAAFLGTFHSYAYMDPIPWG
jgi:hypothetical protein